ncbi:SMC-Scp complex subunit ScpB [Pleionea sediminis]|uniref:SMC-Scp complex subunit ScpB n=1 Tax=Pleionea sediminis TaxID=2569479 RepID=UPI001FE6ABB6|nr:SMC-Scp complex subunit ScpB [Pleionea sediminis]
MSSMTPEKLQNLLEAAIMVYGKPMSIDKMLLMFEEDKRPTTGEVQEALNALNDSYEDRGIELKQVASGFRFQARQDYAEWIARLWEEKAPRYSRALLETLALIAYRQPITRSEIEEVRGVAVSSHIIKTLLEREWIRVVGHRDVPGRPALYATTKDFLDYFNLKSLEELPTLSEIRDLDKINAELELEEKGDEQSDDVEHSTETSDATEKDVQDNDESQPDSAHGDSDQSFESDVENQQDMLEENDEAEDEESHLTTDELMAELDNTLHAVDALTSKKDLSEEEIIEQAELSKSENIQADDETFNDAFEAESVEVVEDSENDTLTESLHAEENEIDSSSDEEIEDDETSSENDSQNRQ